MDGTCHAKPDACAAVVAPVCGCDGKSYNSLCDAQKAGAVVAKGGACAGPAVACGGQHPPCMAGTVCEMNGCGAGATGLCAPATAGACGSGGAPECGCDGNTWPNACFRQKAGIAKDYSGACLVPTDATECKIGPVKPVDCPGGHYCRVPVGTCTGKGVCIKKPVVCDKSSKPVCGCDSKTYGNVCVLEQSGFSMKTPEPCAP